MPPFPTGIAFTNAVSELDIARNFNLLLGSGVGAGDFDGDGACDLFFASLRGPCALYRNRGDWRFEDVTTASGLTLPGRTNTGAVFADVDGDGRVDLLVSSLGAGVALMRNLGGGKFEDATRDSGLTALTGSLSMTLGDVEGDGDLDIYVCNYGAVALSRGMSEFLVRIVDGKPMLRGPGAERMRVVGHRVIEVGEPDTLFLNDGTGRFRAVSWDSSAFVDEDGRPLPAPWDFGLSAQFRDVNGDRAPDLYVCNDFDTPDRFWLNDGRGRFHLLPRLAQRSQSFASMGVDFADVDRDGQLDFLVVEMRSPDHGVRLRQRPSLSILPSRPGVVEDRPEIGRNTLFRSRGDGTFAELANFSGLAASDWSWQGVFLDVDLDGWEDVLVVNGHSYDTQDLDLASARSGQRERLAQLRAMQPLHTPKRAWRNRGAWRFEDASSEWSFVHTNISQGIALADLDNDGDLDVVVNCLNSSPLLLKNRSEGARVAVRLRGAGANSQGIGARITLRGGALPLQSQEMICGGKYLSSDEALRVFAGGSASNEMTLEVIWRSGGVSVVPGVKAGRAYVISETTKSASSPAESASPLKLTPWMSDGGERFRHTHHELPCDDLQLQPLLTRRLSQRGPGACVSDLDGDGHDDLLMAAGREGGLAYYRGDGQGRFISAGSLAVTDDVHALVEWWPVPGVRGVLAVLADHETVATESPLRLVVWESGELRWRAVSAPAFTNTPSTGYCLAVADFDADGDLDVFVGAHAIPGRYPEAAQSRLFKNAGGLLQLDETNTVALAGVGLVNSGVWTDLDSDGAPDLAIACEWGPVRIFRNIRGQLSEKTADGGLAAHTGWWTGIVPADFDGDGRMDLLVGNWGLNGVERASTARPLRLFYGDFLRRGTVDLVETEYDQDRLVPARRLDELSLALPGLAERFRSHRAWAAASADEVMTTLSGTREALATTLATTVFLNRGGRFQAVALPDEAQWAPVQGVATGDFDGDGRLDIFLAQNFFAVRPDVPRLDAGRGLLLQGDGRGGWRPLPGAESGVTVYGEQRATVSGDFDENGTLDLVVTQNGAASRLFLNAQTNPGLSVRLMGPPGNPGALGAVLRLEARGRMGPATELYGGSGWLSHNGLTAVFSAADVRAGGARLHVRWPGGRQTSSTIGAMARRITVRAHGGVVED